MTSKHTPGPWKQSKADETLVVSAAHDDVAHVYGDYETEYERMAADACLIAQAPTMLATLKQVEEILNLNGFYDHAAKCRFVINNAECLP